MTFIHPLLGTAFRSSFLISPLENEDGIDSSLSVKQRSLGGYLVGVTSVDVAAFAFATFGSSFIFLAALAAVVLSIFTSLINFFCFL